jgi:hypothetical protein
MKYHSLIANHEAICVHDPSISSVGKFYKSSDNMSGLIIVVSFPSVAFHVHIFC